MALSLPNAKRRRSSAADEEEVWASSLDDDLAIEEQEIEELSQVHITEGTLSPPLDSSSSFFEKLKHNVKSMLWPKLSSEYRYSPVSRSSPTLDSLEGNDSKHTTILSSTTLTSLEHPRLLRSQLSTEPGQTTPDSSFGPPSSNNEETPTRAALKASFISSSPKKRLPDSVSPSKIPSITLTHVPAHVPVSEAPTTEQSTSPSLLSTLMSPVFKLLHSASGSDPEHEQDENQFYEEDQYQDEFSQSCLLIRPAEKSVVINNVIFDEEIIKFFYNYAPLRMNACFTHYALPPKEDDLITLVLDLDETLVHCNLSQIQDFCFKFGIHVEGQEFVVYGRKRPHLLTFLEAVAKKFEVVVFTASRQVYAERLLSLIDPLGLLIKHRLYREQCRLVEGNFIKDLSILGRDLSRTVIIDNSPQTFVCNVTNGIPISSWYDDPSDGELLSMLPLLDKLHIHESGDVRRCLKQELGLHRVYPHAFDEIDL